MTDIDAQWVNDIAQASAKAGMTIAKEGRAQRGGSTPPVTADDQHTSPEHFRHPRGWDAGPHPTSISLLRKPAPLVQQVPTRPFVWGTATTSRPAAGNAESVRPTSGER